MTVEQLERPTGHVFVSYVREDKERVDRLVAYLEDAGIRVWRDTEDLWPGQDWRAQIRKAISEGAFAFLACFSDNSERRESSYQNEELLLAVEQLRQRPQDRVWLIPVRFSESRIPDLEVGPGKTLNSFQIVDLFDNTDWPGAPRLLTSISAILGMRHPAPEPKPGPPARSTSPGDVLRSILLDPSKEIEVEDLVNETVARVRETITDPLTFPTQSSLLDGTIEEATGFLLDQLQKYVDTTSDLLEMLMRAGAYGKEWHASLWARAVQRIANTVPEQRAGRTVLINLRGLPLTLAVYATTLGAVHRENWDAFRAVTTDAKYRHDGRVDAVVIDSSPWLTFERESQLANIAMIARRKRNVGDKSPTTSGRTGHPAPPCGYVEDVLRPMFKTIFSSDDIEFTEAFDKAEILMGWVADHEADQAKKHDRPFVPTGWHGSFLRRPRFNEIPPERRLFEEAAHAGADWPPLRARMFNGSSEEALQAGESYLERMQELRGRPYS